MNARLDCDEALTMVHERMDGALDTDRQAALDRHLESCDECRQREQELLRMRDELRDMPLLTLPEEDLQRIWDRTVRAPVALDAARARRRRFWIPAAAAAVFVMIVAPISISIIKEQREREALAKLKYAFQLTDRAMRRSSESAGLVLKGDVFPAVKRVPGVGKLMQ